MSYAVGGYGDPQSIHVPHVPDPHTNIHYPADVLQGDRSRQIADTQLDTLAHQLRTQCPATSIGVYGYSLGASAASLTVDRWQTDPTINHNTQATFYGNPRQPTGSDGWGGIETVGLPNIPGIYTWRGPHTTGPIPIDDVCHQRQDIICSAPTPLQRDPVGAIQAAIGYLTGGHNYN